MFTDALTHKQGATGWEGSWDVLLSLVTSAHTGVTLETRHTQRHLATGDKSHWTVQTLPQGIKSWFHVFIKSKDGFLCLGNIYIFISFSNWWKNDLIKYCIELKVKMFVMFFWRWWSHWTIILSSQLKLHKNCLQVSSFFAVHFLFSRVAQCSQCSQHTVSHCQSNFAHDLMENRADGLFNYFIPSTPSPAGKFVGKMLAGMLRKGRVMGNLRIR